MSATITDKTIDSGPAGGASDGLTWPLDIDRAAFRADFDRRHFLFSHQLAADPAFSLPRLIELARDTARARPKDLYFDVGQVAIGQRWDETTRGSLPIEETIRRIEHEGAWIVLWRAELDPAYRALLNDVMVQLTELAGPELRRQIKKQEVIIFITSPNRVTTYHIDRECNFLLQIQGEKEISVFPAGDREVLPEAEIERFWTTDNNAPVYRPHLQGRAAVHMLRPGVGVHIPVNAPHWLKNGNNISVSASFNVQFKDGVRADAYRANYYLRKLGLRPKPPIAWNQGDWLKRGFGAAAFKARQLYHGRGPRD